MPEGDSLHRAALRLQVLVGQNVEVESPNPQAAVKRLPERLSGKRLESVEAVGKNLLLRFEGGAVLRSHLRMTGRWQVRKRDSAIRGRPWLVLRGTEHEALLWNGPVLELHTRGVQRLGPDILAPPPDFDAMVARFRDEPQGRELGDALLDQRVVAGIGTVWRSEALWAASLSPWVRLAQVSDDDLRRVLREAARQMRASVDRGWKPSRAAYGRAGHGCRRCGTPLRSHGQGDANRIVYWCPECQQGGAAPGEA